MENTKQTYLDEVSEKALHSGRRLGFELSDIIDGLIEDLDNKEVTYIYDRKALKIYIIDKARREANVPGTYGWNGENVLEMLELIDELSEEI